MKRDDLLGLAGGGNKTRKLEFLVADALAQGADTLITCGAVQSNHCRLTLAAAVHEGLRCRLVLEERVPGSYDKQASGNNFLYALLGVDAITVVPGGSDMLAAMQAVANAVEQAGGKPYIIPGGGSNPLGAIGYVACVQELAQQMLEHSTNFDYIVVPSGSGGTHAGVLVGVEGTHLNIPVLGINVSRPNALQEKLIYDLAVATATHVACPAPERDKVRCYDSYVGAGYSRPTPAMAEAVTLLARTEGILLDPVYTGKQMAGLIDLVRGGFFAPTDKVLFLHTGGAPALYHYRGQVLA
ncbi:MAG: L-cysteate sulfo-lyase [Firmicutes bacterium]|nr:L-cysteate sulfo-lyase [candidate division NPL-UPA2 bacterium]